MALTVGKAGQGHADGQNTGFSVTGVWAGLGAAGGPRPLAAG